MQLYSLRNVDFQHEDDRGKLIQLVHEGFDQINVLESKKGSVRGTHYHKRATEAFFVVNGSVKVTFWTTEAREETYFRCGDFFEIRPLVMHHMFFPEDCLMVQMYSIPVERADGSKDIYTEENNYA